MVKKEQKKKIANVSGIIIGGVEYINKTQAIQLAGITFPTLRKKVKIFNIEQVKLPTSKLPYFRRKDIEEAIRLGWI